MMRKHGLVLIGVISLFGLAGCGPKEPAPLPAPKKDEATVQRERH